MQLTLKVFLKINGLPSRVLIDILARQVLNRSLLDYLRAGAPGMEGIIQTLQELPEEVLSSSLVESVYNLKPVTRSMLIEIKKQLAEEEAAAEEVREDGQ